MVAVATNQRQSSKNATPPTTITWRTRNNGLQRNNNNNNINFVGILQRRATIVLCLIGFGWLYGGLFLYYVHSSSSPKKEIVNLSDEYLPNNRDSSPSNQTNVDEQHHQQQQHHHDLLCPVLSISSLSEYELHPKAGITSSDNNNHGRHMVTPPDGGKLSLVCCKTTKGTFSALLHHRWAPIGVQRLVEMINDGYFSSSRIALFRCTDACQFGLAGNPNETRKYDKQIQDDVQWMPPGKDHRMNEYGVRRYPQGFWTYAGGGNHSRSNQFVITLKPNQFMGGGSPWEVPLGELVGEESFNVLPRLYTGYGEKGPSQGLLRREGTSERVLKEWPLLDYILSCHIVDEREDYR